MPMMHGDRHRFSNSILLGCRGLGMSLGSWWLRSEQRQAPHSRSQPLGWPVDDLEGPQGLLGSLGTPVSFTKRFWAL